MAINTSAKKLISLATLPLMVACGPRNDDEGPLGSARDPAAIQAAPADAAAVGPSEDAHVHFVAPEDGELVEGPLVDGKVIVDVAMHLAHAELRPAGDLEPGTGHHHVIVDEGPIPEGQPIPFDGQHLHFGQAQAQAEVLLSPGEHTLTLQLADGAHRSYGPRLSATISIVVVDAERASSSDTEL